MELVSMLERVGSVAAAIAASRREVRLMSAAAADGDYVRQGDVYIVRLSAVPSDAVLDAPAAQLAPGTSQGSRHLLDSTDGVTFYKRATPDPISDGPILEVAARRTITHPEHIHVVLEPGVYGIGYQRTVDADERERRALD